MAFFSCICKLTGAPSYNVSALILPTLRQYSHEESMATYSFKVSLLPRENTTQNPSHYISSPMIRIEASNKKIQSYEYSLSEDWI